MSRFAKVGSGLALAAAVLALYGCGRADTGTPGASGGGSAVQATSGTLVWALPDEPGRLDPAFNKDLYEGIVSGLIFDGLVGFGRGTTIEPRLASKWEVSPDGRSLTFHLRDAKFSNGRPVTGADVRYSFTRLLLPATNSGRKWVVDRIDGADDVVAGRTRELRGIATPDPRTVVITLREPYPAFLTMLAMPSASIIPEGAAGTDAPDAAFDRAPVGTGPWVLARWVRDQRLEFAPNPQYWGQAPTLGGVVYQVQLDDTARQRAFEAGTSDIYEVGFAAHDRWARDPARSAQIKAVQELRTDFLAFMNDKPALADRRVRQAVAHAVDTRSIFENLQKGRGVPAHGPIPPGIAGYRPDKAPRPHDIARAKALLDEAGATTLTLDLWYRDEALNAEIARAAKANLAEAGVAVNLVPRDLAALRAGVWQGQPDMYLGSWTLDYPDPENALVPTFHSRNIPRQGNGSHFSNPAVDRALEDAEREADPAQRIAKFEKAEDLIIEEQPWIPLFHRKTHYAVQPWIEGWAPAVMYNSERFAGVSKTR